MVWPITSSSRSAVIFLLRCQSRVIVTSTPFEGVDTCVSGVRGALLQTTGALAEYHERNPEQADILDQERT